MNASVPAGSVLIVDDNPSIVALLGNVLREAGYDVRAAIDGARGLTVAAARAPDLVLLDIRMPGMDGFEVCQKLKQQEATRAVPVIVISALDDVNEKLRAFEAGAADYVTKPFEPREVLSRVGAHVQLYRLRLELETKQRELERSQKELAEQNEELRQRNEELVNAERRTRHVFSALASALPGTVLDGKYRLDQKIGSGGFATVFRAEQLELARPVAVKVFRPWEGSDTPDALDRFKREGVAACRIQHPNAVSVTDFGISESGIAYLVMELLRGVTVADLIISETRLPLARCVEILIPVCEVLAAAHLAGLVHRDIKPENVFLHRIPAGEIVKVLDFGIAKLVEADDGRQETRGMLLGTLGFVAPERVLGLEYGPPSDIYSVGVLFYTMLTGLPPFYPKPDEEPLATLMRQVNEPVPPLDVPGLPQAAIGLVERMLATIASERPTARELVDELARFRRK